MPNTATLPDKNGLNQMLGALLRRKVSTTPLKPIVEKELIVAGHYIDGNQKLVGALFADKPLVVMAGSAFSLIPADAAKDALRESQLDEMVQDNFHEVLNICSRLLNLGTDQRITLSKSEFPPAARSPAAAALLTKPGKRADYDVEIDGYGKGKLTLVLAA
jgi:hypothetical protein